MKGLRAKDMVDTEPAELRQTLRKLEEELFKNRLKKNTNQLENTMLIRNARRDIARVNTVLAARLRRGGAEVISESTEASQTEGSEPAAETGASEAPPKTTAAKSSKSAKPAKAAAKASKPAKAAKPAKAPTKKKAAASSKRGNP